MAIPQCCYLAKGAKRPSHTTNTIKFDRIPFDPCSSIKRFDLCPFDQKNSTYLQPPISPQELSNCIEHAKQSSSSLVPSGYTCSFCLLGDLNLPDTDWNSMYSTSSFENQYLDIFVSHGLSASINIPTHKAGNTLDNFLLENVYQFDGFMVIKDLFLNDQYPILFNCLIPSSSSKSNPLASSLNSFIYRYGKSKTEIVLQIINQMCDL